MLVPGLSRFVGRRARTARRLLTPIALHAPTKTGPRRWRRFVASARINRARPLARSDPAAALRLLEPLLTSASTPASAWSVAALAHERVGDLDVALHMVRRAVESGSYDVATLLTYRQFAVKAAHRHDGYQALRELARTLPRSQTELNRAAEALRFGNLELSVDYREMLLGNERVAKMSLEPVEEVVAELRLIQAHQHSPQRFADEVSQVLYERRRPRRVVTLALSRRRAWPELAQFLSTIRSATVGPGARDEKFPAEQVRLAAKNAFKAGYNSAASIAAAQVLAVDPRDADMRAIQDEATDQLTIARTGWTYPPIQSTPYRPDSKAVLSVLGQSLPLRSSGYATRSHGLMTGMADRGWHMRGVTRLGFPYDLWWKPDDPRPVPLVDHIDGIAYHRLLPDGVRTYPRYPLASYIDACAKGVADNAIDHQACLIHAASLYDVGMAGLTAARRLGLPFIYEIRGLKQLLEVARDPAFVDSDRHELLDRLEVSVVRSADVVFVITEALRHEIARRGVDEQRLVVVPNGVRTTRFQVRERDPELERQLRLSGKAVIGYVGALVHYEGLDVLLDAVAGLKEHRQDFHVLVVGDGAHERAIRSHADRLRLDDVVTFTGRVSHADVERYLSLVDIAPLPRLPLQVCELISPLKPFESMAMGKVVVASDVAALTEIVQDGKTGRVFRKGDPADLRRVLGQLLDEPGQRRALGLAAREWVVRERDWATITGIVDSTYRELLERRRFYSNSGSVSRALR